MLEDAPGGCSNGARRGSGACSGGAQGCLETLRRVLGGCSGVPDGSNSPDSAGTGAFPAHSGVRVEARSMARGEGAKAPSTGGTPRCSCVRARQGPPGPGQCSGSHQDPRVALSLKAQPQNPSQREDVVQTSPSPASVAKHGRQRLPPVSSLSLQPSGQRNCRCRNSVLSPVRFVLQFPEPHVCPSGLVWLQSGARLSSRFRHPRRGQERGCSSSGFGSEQRAGQCLSLAGSIAFPQLLAGRF